MATEQYTSVTQAHEVTEEILTVAESIFDGWYADDNRIDWEDFLDRLDGVVLSDGTTLDLGGSLVSPAILAIKKHAARLQKTGLLTSPFRSSATPRPSRAKESTPMDNLSLDANLVPVIYRVRVEAHGAVIDESTVTRLPAEMPAAVAAVRNACQDAGYPEVRISYWPA